MTPAQEAYKRRTEIAMYKAMAHKDELERDLRHAIRQVRRYELMLEDLEYQVEKAERK